MNKAELIALLAQKANLSKTHAEQFVEAFVDVTINALKAGGEVTIAGFGTFSARSRAGRIGVNPQKPTEKIQIPSVIVPKFKAGKTLKDALKKR